MRIDRNISNIQILRTIITLTSNHKYHSLILDKRTPHIITKIILFIKTRYVHFLFQLNRKNIIMVQIQTIEIIDAINNPQSMNTNMPQGK